ncbi:MAG: hypothetical protein E6902_04910 [Paeniclostridium sordellii]|nr:hypothetical protein [Paeniclostridium sordellii]
MNYISTWLYIESKDDESYYDQVGGSTTDKRIQDIYWKCVFDFFHSSLKFNKECKHIFFTNKNIDNVVIGKIQIRDFFKQNNISVVNIELTNKTPKDWFGSWRNQFYIFDILKYIKEEFSDEDKFLILDSDCVFTKNIGNLFLNLSTNTINYNINYDKNQIVNGISEVQMTEIYNEIFNKNEDLIHYYGGEFFVGSMNTISKILTEFELLWEQNLKRYSANKMKLNEEAHFLSCIYKSLNIENNEGNNFIKRMWTSFKFNNINNEDMELPIWHLPAEKQTGFNTMFNKISVDYKKYLDIDEKEYRDMLKQNFGIPSRTFKKYVLDIKSIIIKKIMNI